MSSIKGDFWLLLWILWECKWQVLPFIVIGLILGLGCGWLIWG